MLSDNSVLPMSGIAQRPVHESDWEDVRDGPNGGGPLSATCLRC